MTRLHTLYPRAASTQDWRGAGLRFVKMFPLAVVLAALVVVGEIMSSGVFFRASNLTTVIYQYSVTALMALGELFVMLTGGIDLSVGAVVILSGVFAGDLSHSQNLAVSLPQLSSGLAMTIAIAVGAGIGLVNGITVAFTRIPPFIVTLATMLMAEGLAAWVTGGQGVGGSSFFSSFGSTLIGSVPLPVIVTAAIFVVAAALFRIMTYRTLFYAVGSNEVATALAGAPIRSPKIVAYTLCGALSGFAGIVYLARSASVIPGTDNSLLLAAISAVVLGGVALEGGRGGIMGPVLGTLVLAALGNIMNLELLSPSIQSGVQGGIIVIAVAGNAALARWRGAAELPPAVAPEALPAQS